MNVRWDMALFMFAAFAGAALLLYSAVNEKESKRPWAALVSAAAEAAAIAVIVNGLNNPAKIITVLSAPTKGFSSAVFMQAIAAAAALFVFFKKGANNTAAKAAVIAVSLLSAISLSRIYMISTRPALNSFIVAVMLAALLFQTAGIMGKGSTKTYRLAVLAVSAVYGLSAAVFSIRLKMIVPQDRILNFAEVTAGYIAPIYWGTIICSFAIPFLYALAAAKKNVEKRPPYAIIAANAAGILLLFMLICQTPVVENGINNRIFF